MDGVVLIVLGLGCLAAVIVVIAAVVESLTQRTKAPVTFPYQKRPALLTPAELNFYQVLRQCVDADTVEIIWKPRIADVLDTPPNDLAAFRRISQKHLDFVICDRVSSCPLLAIELDDRSHQRPDRQKRDEFVDQAMSAAGMPLLHVPVQAGYHPKTLRFKMDQAIQGKPAAPTEPGGAVAEAGPEEPQPRPASRDFPSVPEYHSGSYGRGFRPSRYRRRF